LGSDSKILVSTFIGLWVSKFNSFEVHVHQRTWNQPSINLVSLLDFSWQLATFGFEDARR